MENVLFRWRMGLDMMKEKCIHASWTTQSAYWAVWMETTVTNINEGGEMEERNGLVLVWILQVKS